MRPRCKRRDCARCWTLRSRETARCLILDARVQKPRLCMTLTTAERWQDLDPADVREGMARVVRLLRRRAGICEYFAAVEFTTGRARRSGGARRLHVHALLKCDGDPDELRNSVRETWRKVTGAYIIDLAELRSPGAALGYLGLHHRKPSQAPPAAWRGMTERASRGYWHLPIAALREQARRELREEALRNTFEGIDRHEAREIIDSTEAQMRRLRWTAGATLAEPIIGRDGSLDPR